MNVETVYDNGVGPVNEDALLTMDPTFGVFDGASGMEPYKTTDGKTGAAIASTIASYVFGDSDKPLIELAREANESIGEAMDEAGINRARKTAVWATSGAVVRLDDDTFDWLCIGDCVILVVKTDGSYEVYQSEYDQDLETLLMWQEEVRKGTENIREVLESQMLKVRSGMDLDYGDLNGSPEMERFLAYGTASLEGVAHILLFTDGLELPKADPSAPDDFETLIDLFRTGGLSHVQKYVRAKEAADPNCLTYPRFKQHDDIAGIALSF